MLYIGKPQKPTLQRPLFTSPTNFKPKGRLSNNNHGDPTKERRVPSLLSYYGKPGDPVTPRGLLTVFRLKDPKVRKEKKGKKGVLMPDIEDVEYPDWIERLWFRKVDTLAEIGLIPFKIVLHSRLFAWFRRNGENSADDKED